MKNAYLLYILLIALLSSCNSYKKPKEECLHDSFIYEFSKGDFEDNFPPVNMRYYFFVELNNDSIIATSNFYLYKIYKQYYFDKFSRFHTFLCYIYNNDFIMERDFLNGNILSNGFIFKKDDTFENLDLSELKERYLEKSEYSNYDLYFLEPFSYSHYEEYNLMYYFFKNEYYITHSDISGLYSISKH